MILGKKLVVILPAYNAAKTLKKTYDEIPFDIVDDVVLVDDRSSDTSLVKWPIAPPFSPIFITPIQKHKTPVSDKDNVKPVSAAAKSASTNWRNMSVSCQKTSLEIATIIAIKNIPIQILFKSIIQISVFIECT